LNAVPVKLPNQVGVDVGRIAQACQRWLIGRGRWRRVL